MSVEVETALVEFVQKIIDRPRTRKEQNQQWEMLDRYGFRILFDGLERELRSGEQLFTMKSTLQLNWIAYDLANTRPEKSMHQVSLGRLCDILNKHLKRLYIPALTGLKGRAVLHELVRRWNKYKLVCRWVVKFFLGLDTLMQQSDVTGGNNASRAETSRTVTSAALRVFNSFLDDNIKNHLSESMIDLIRESREGGSDDLDAVHDAAQALIFMGVAAAKPDIKSVTALANISMNDKYKIIYTRFFEEPLVNDAASYFGRRRDEWLSFPSAEYLRMVESALVEEESRLRCLPVSGTWARVRGVMEQEMLKTPQNEVLGRTTTGIAAMITEERHEDVALTFRMYRNIEGALDNAAGIMKEHILGQGSIVNEERLARLREMEAAKKKEPSHDPEFVEKCAGLSQSYTSLVHKMLDGDPRFARATEEALRSIVNDDKGNYCNAQILARYADYALRGSLRGQRLDAAEVDERVGSVLDLFRHLKDKDMFVEEYRTLMARRLLEHKSTSDEAEGRVIGEMKLICGAQFTARLDGMVNDLRLARRQTDEFTATTRGREYGDTFFATVLSQGFWPSFRPIAAELPPPLSTMAHYFAEYYTHRYQSRRLKWVLSQGSTEIRFRAARGRFLLQSSTMQAVVLLFFNRLSDEEEVTGGKIASELNIPEDVCKKVLHSLACNKRNVILLKSPVGSTVAMTNTFKVNTGFKSKSKVIRTPMPSLEEAKTKERVGEERSQVVDAAVVRVMKARKQLSIKDLEMEVLRQLQHFSPTPRLIKRRIEDLVEREYLERVNRTEFRYLA